MSSLPYMRLYIGDYLADTSHLTCEEHGAYFLLIIHYHRGGGLPEDEEQLARICRLTAKRWQIVRPAIVAFFSPGWRHRRIDRELGRAEEKSIKASLSANKRWNKQEKMRPHSKRNPLAMRQFSKRNVSEHSGSIISDENENEKSASICDDSGIEVMRSQCVGNTSHIHKDTLRGTITSVAKLATGPVLLSSEAIRVISQRKGLP